jgi:anthranilate phosphoribosyltransferase
VVHGEGGLDEISLTSPTRVIEVEGSDLSYFILSPSDFGIDSAKDPLPKAADAKDSANIILEVLDNRRLGQAAEQIVLLNAAAAILINGRAPNLTAAYKTAEESLRSGEALDKLERLARETSK